MLVYFHIDELNRDAVVASALRMQLHSKGARLIYGSRTSHWLLKYFASLFDAIILPRPLFINNPSYKNHHILYTESVGRVVSAQNPLFSAYSLLDQKCMEGDYSELDSIKRIYLWGNDGLESIRNFDPKLVKKCKVVGHPRLDPFCLKSKSKTKNKHTVGLITRQPLLNDYMGRSVFELISNQSCAEDNFLFSNKNNSTYLLENDDYVAEAYNQSSYLNLTLRLIIMLLSNGYDVDLRIHPRESHKNWKMIQKRLLKNGLKFNIATASEPYMHWAMRVGVIVGPASTSFYECISCGIPVISLSGIDKLKVINEDAEENQEFMKFIESPSSLDGVLRSVGNKIQESKQSKFYLNSSPELQLLLKRQINHPDNSAIYKITEDLLSSEYKKKNKRLRYYLCFLLVLFNAYFRFIYDAIFDYKVFANGTSAYFCLTFNKIHFINSLVRGDRN